jgi:hypothetical protein
METTMSPQEIKTKKSTKQIEIETKPLKLTNLYIVYYLVNVHAIVCHSIQCWHLFFLFFFYAIQFDWITEKRKDQTGQRPSKIITIIDIHR